ncbi:hypothetical protein EMPS_04925 [Entomortierella parvispora]|uniref:Uncharacterized protein n=1 Tax=Entomortierella parvispora TaxID=205924 RepID=A0A9P3H9I1_9FUNG|nr:hypothetical protein EMPS_04925 [Entomortierella parvispora]
MSPQVKVAGNKDFDETLAHLPAPPAPSLLYESQLAPSASENRTTSSTSLSILDDEDYNSFYNAIPTTADALYTSTPTGLSPTSTSSSAAYSTTSSSVSSSSYAAPWQPEATFSSSSLLLGSSTRTPMELVNISNIKLNNDIFSSRSLSIHRRILVKNLLTLLYETYPMLNWYDDGQNLQVSDDGGYFEEGQDTSGELLLGEDEQNGWMERTLSAAGLAEDDDDADADDDEQDDDNVGSHGAPGRHLARDNEDDSDSDDDLEGGYVHITVAKKASASLSSLPQAPSYTARNPAFALSTPNLATPQNKAAKTTKVTPAEVAAAAALSPPLPPLPIPSAPSSRTPYTPSPASSGSKTSASASAPAAVSSSTKPKSPLLSSAGIPGSGQKSPLLAPSHGLPQVIPRVGKESLPRPKSVELPQSLNNYLSAVFDVDWSVGLSLTEDSLFTLTTPGAGSGNGPVPSAAVAAAAKRRSIVSSSPMAVTSNLASMSSPSTSSSLGSPILGSSPRSKRASRVPLDAAAMESGSKPDSSPNGSSHGSPHPQPSKDLQESGQGINSGINGVSSNGEVGNRSQSNISKSPPALPVATNGSSSPVPPALPRKTLVPGRRSSLVHSAQSTTAANGSNGMAGGSKARPMVTRHESYNNNLGENNKFKTSPPSRPVSTASFSGGQFAAGFNSNGSDSATSRQGSPSYSRRTSSLPSAKGSGPDNNGGGPMALQRNLSSDNVLKSSQGNSQGTLTRSSSANPFASPLPSSLSSSASGSQSSNSRNSPQAPRQLSILPMFNNSNQPPASPPRSPNRAGASTNGSESSMKFSSAPVLPPLFPLPEPQQQKAKTPNGYSHQHPLSPPSSPGSNGFMPQPATYLLSQTDDQPRLLSPPTSPGIAAVPSARQTRAGPNFVSKTHSMSSPDLIGSSAGSGYNQAYQSQHQHRPLPLLPEQAHPPKDRGFDSNGNTLYERDPPAYVDMGFRTLSRSSSRRVSSGNGGIPYQDSQFPYPSPNQSQNQYQSQQPPRGHLNGGAISAPLPQIPSMYPQTGNHPNYSRENGISNSNRNSAGKNSGQRWSSMKNMLKIKAHGGR